MTDLRIGAFGYGARGGLIKHAHKPGEGSRVVALWDPSPESQQRFRDAFGDEPTIASSLEEFLALDLDAAFVVTPDHLHEENALALLEADIPVYLEKPMAITIEGCDRLLATAQKRGGKLYLGHNMRHMPFVREMKRLIDDGAIGEPKVAWVRHFVGHGGEFYFQDWHAERSKGTSLLLQKGAHDLDVLHWLCGSYAETVSGIGDQMMYHQPSKPESPVKWWQKTGDELLSAWPPAALGNLNPVIDVEDVSMVNMRLQNGILASYQQCHFTPDYWRNYTIVGTEGRLENFGDGAPGTTIRIWNKRHDWAPAGDIEVEVAKAEGGHGGADPMIVAEFLRYVREGGATDTSPVAARYAVAAGCAGAESLRNGSVPVTVPRVPDEVSAYFSST